LDANARRPRVVLIDFLHVAGLGRTARVNAVEALSIAAGKIVILQAGVGTRLELVTHRAGLHSLGDRLRRLQVVVRQLKTVVAQGLLGGAYLLALEPVIDALVLARAAVDFLIFYRGGPGHRRMTLGRV